MAIFDIFKKKKEVKKPAEKKVAKPRQKPAVKPEKETVAVPEKIRRSSSGTSYRILKEPHISEKATDLTKKDWYIFRVFADANKSEVKKAVEAIYGVEVIDVRIINVPRKKRRLGRIEGWRRGYKKAAVRLKPGQKIEVLPR